VLQRILLIALTGGLGALARYGLSGLVRRYNHLLPSGESFPWGTVTVNLVGCLIFGILAASFDRRLSINPETRIVVLTGFMGAFTTFSTFAFESAQLMRESQWMLAAGNVALQNTVGIAALFLGLALGRLI